MTSLSIFDIRAKSIINCTKTYMVEQKLSDIIRKFPSVLVLQPFTTGCNHQAQHFMETKGRPVFEKPRHLSPEKLVIAKAMFELMIVMGIYILPKSQWVFPFQLVKKKYLINGGPAVIIDG